MTSPSISENAISAAFPSPTIPGTFSVDERSPLSCPPPRMIGDSSTPDLT